MEKVTVNFLDSFNFWQDEDDGAAKCAKIKEVELQCSIILLKVANILPKEWKETFIKESFLSGGCLYGMLNDKEYSDYDIFLCDKNLAEKIKEYYSETLPNSGNTCYVYKYPDNVKCYDDNQKNTFYVTENSVTINSKYQIIYKNRFVNNNPKKTILDFDFKHCLIAFLYGKLSIFTHDPTVFFENEILLNEWKESCSLRSFARMAKYTKRGMFVSPKTIGKMLKITDSIIVDKEKVDELLSEEYY